MYLNKAYIRYKEDLPESPSTFAAVYGFRELGVETVPFYGFGDLETFEDIGPEVGVFGFVGDVLNALARIGISEPQLSDYPAELEPYLGRKVWQSTLGEVRATGMPTFIKPLAQKRFTGFIYRGPNREAVRIAALPDSEPIWCSEQVSFVSEYRTYVKDDEILGVKWYKGDWSIIPNKTVVEEAVRAFKSSPRGVALDFGVTDTGETRLVEVNDSYALGNYGLHPALYAGMMEARWEELTRRP